MAVFLIRSASKSTRLDRKQPPPPSCTWPSFLTRSLDSNSVANMSAYDRIFHQVEGYDMKRPRDDRQHWRGRGLNINQERSRAVPVLSSSEYGRHLPPVPDQTARQYARVASTKSEFYMKNGIIWSLAEGYGSVAPI
uniref:Cilia and flagella associated protein 90 n=1 Tax=Fundulus heteroclitus TaxID=8078 RepID=A0A3Q2QUI0_FUNHE